MTHRNFLNCLGLAAIVVVMIGAVWPKDRVTYTHPKVELLDMRHDGHYFIVALGRDASRVRQQRSFSHSVYQSGVGIGVGLIHHPDCPCRS